MKFKCGIGVVALLVVGGAVVVGGALTLAQTPETPKKGSAPQQEKSKSVDKAKESSTSECCANRESEYYTLKVNSDGSLAKDADGRPVLVRMDAPPTRAEEMPKAHLTETIEDTADCETEPTGGSGARRDCDSPDFIVTLPAGYYFIEADASVHWEIDRGTDNRHWLIWSDRVEIYPGTSVYVPRTLTFGVHARSAASAGGPAGRSRAHLIAPYKRLPPTD